MLIVFLHGWGVRNPDYGALPAQVEERLGATVTDVWLSQYVSYSDTVTMADLVDAFERTRLKNFPDAPFACVTHSTGGPIMREWLARYGGTGRLTHLVMLAPPNHGSALAQLGKGRLSRMAAWFSQGEPGQQILNWLELGSKESWKLNTTAIDDPPSSFLFSLIGSGIDPKFYDHLNSYTAERGSDGVVRAASANLNYSFVELRQSGSEFRVVNTKRAQPGAFGILPGLSHSGAAMGILRGASTAQWVERCLSVKTGCDYEHLSQQLPQESPTKGSMLVFRVRDVAGRPVNDYDLYLTAGPEYNADALPRNFFIDRQCNQVTRNVLTYYVDHSVFEKTKELGLRIVARPDAGPVNFAPAEFRSSEAVVNTLLRPHETVLVDITLERRLETALFLIQRAAPSR